MLVVRQSRAGRRRGAGMMPRWTIPFCFTYDRDGRRGETCAVLQKDYALIQLDTKSCPRWLLPHVAGVGHYDLKVTRAMVDRALAGWSELAPVERVFLARQVRRMIGTDSFDVDVGLGLIPRLLREDNRAALEAAAGLASWGASLPESHMAAYDRWVVATFGPEARRLGWLPRPGEPADLARRRQVLLAWLAEAGDPVLRDESLRLAASWRDLPAGARSSVLWAAIRADPTGALFDRLLADVLVEKDRVTRAHLFGALAATRDPGRVARLLGLLLDPTLDIREISWLPAALWREPERAQAESFARQNLAALLARLPRDSDFSAISPLVEVFTGACSDARREEIRTFVQATFSRFPGGPREVARQLEAMDGCIWRRTWVGPRLARWLDREAARPPRRSSRP